MPLKPPEKLFGQSDSALSEYAIDTFRPEDALLETVRKRTISSNLARISVSLMDGLHLEILTRITGVQRAVEIGTLGGYSAICIARGLQPNGKLYTCEIRPQSAAVARDNLKFAGLENTVEVLVGPALETLRTLENRGPFDLVFIVADKSSYPEYLHWAAQHLRVGGVVIGDNTFAWGLVTQQNIANPTDAASAQGITLFNQTLANDKRFRSTLFPTGEGLTVGVKISN